VASGDPVLQILGIRPPRATSAYPVEIAGTSTPAERIIVWRFDDGAPTTNYLDYLVALHRYGAGGLRLRFAHGFTSGTPGNAVRISAALRRIVDDAEDLDTTAHTYVYTAATFTVAGTQGEWAYDTIDLTDGANMDGMLDNEYGILRIRREPGDGADTLAGNWFIGALSGTEI
jgi:hypothetical protein